MLDSEISNMQSKLISIVTKGLLSSIPELEFSYQLSNSRRDELSKSTSSKANSRCVTNFLRQALRFISICLATYLGQLSLCLATLL